jgi:hypothetical protein
MKSQWIPINAGDEYGDIGSCRGFNFENILQQCSLGLAISIRTVELELLT